MFGKKKKTASKDFSKAPCVVMGRIVAMFADEIIALKGAARGERLEIWIGKDPALAQEIKGLMPELIQRINGIERCERYFQLVLEERIGEEQDKTGYHLYVVRK